MKLFFNFHKNHQQPFNHLKTNRFFNYFDDKNSNIYVESPKKSSSEEKEKEKLIKKERKNLVVMKTIKEIDKFSPDNDKKIKIIDKIINNTQKNLKKPENLKTYQRLEIKKEKNLLELEEMKEELKENNRKPVFLYDSSLSRLNKLGLEQILNEIIYLEKTSSFDEFFT